MKIIEKKILQQAIIWASNILIESFSNAQLENGPARENIKKALEHLAQAGLELRIGK